METRETLLTRLDAKQQELRAEIERMEAKAKEKSADAQADLQDRLQTLRAKRDQTQQKIEDLRTAGAGAWEDAKAGAELALADLKNAADSARSRF